MNSNILYFCFSLSRNASEYRIFYSTIKNFEVKLTEQVERFIVHEGWNSNTSLNDIALIKVAGILKLGETNAKKIDLNRDLTIEKETLLTTYGYGFGSPVLSMSQSHLFPKKQCMEDYDYGEDKRVVEDKQFCIKVEYSDVADGDSGGPVTIKDRRGYPYLAGIVSFGTNHTKPNELLNYRPSVYTNVRSYYGWIKETVFNSSSPEERKHEVLIESFEETYDPSKYTNITYIKIIQINKRILWSYFNPDPEKTQIILLIYILGIISMYVAHRVLKRTVDI